MAKKITKTEKEARVQRIAGLILSGCRTHADIVREVETWGIKTRQAQNYLTAAREYIKSATAEQREMQIGIALGRIEEIYREARERGQLKTALQAVRELIDLLGLSFEADLARRLTELEERINENLSTLP
jgi:beta-xylosidase